VSPWGGRLPEGFGPDPTALQLATPVRLSLYALVSVLTYISL
jgi:hypothetical protein